MRRARDPVLHLAPPWLWFWLAIYLLSIPSQMRLLLPILSGLLSPDLLPGESLNPASVFLRLAGLVESVPFLVVFLGVLAIFIPGARAAFLHRSYRLSDPPDLPVIQEIRAFLAGQAPDLAIAANLLRPEGLAFVYPLSYRKYGIALFGGLIKLWRADRPAAQAVLSHEVAHYRQGDPLVVGAGAFFRAYMRLWLPIFLLTVALPLLLASVYEVIRIVASSDPLFGLGFPFGLFSTLLRIGNLLVGFYLPGLLWMALTLLLWTASIMILPLAGIWSAELGADQMVFRLSPAGHGLIQALSSLSDGEETGWQRILNWISHPPARLRRWMVAQPQHRLGVILLLVIFPLAFIVRTLALIAWAISVYLSVGLDAPQIVAEVMRLSASFLRSSLPVWAAMGLVVSLWPLAARLLEGTSRSGQGKPGWLLYRGYLGPVLLVGVLGFSLFITAHDGLWRLQDATPSPGARVETGTQQAWQAGEKVEVEWQGAWYPAEILKVEAGEYTVHYEGYDSSWDEKVPPERIRSRSP